MKRIITIYFLVALMAGPVWAEELDQQRALEFIEQCRNVGDRKPNLRKIYWKLRVCEAAEKPFDVAVYANYIVGLQNVDGGFGLWPKDVSTPEATLMAVTVLKKAQAEPADKTTCVNYLKSCLESNAKRAQVYSDLLIQRDIHACLISLSLLGAELPELDKYLKILEEDGQPWGIYYRITAELAFGRPVSKREVWVKKLDKTTAENLGYSWSSNDNHYALEAMQLLGELSRDVQTLQTDTADPEGEPWNLVDAWRRLRRAKLLKLQLNGLKTWLEKPISIKPEPVGGYGPMPGLGGDSRASFLAYRFLRQRGVAVQAGPELAKQWQDKQQQGGFYESSAMEFSKWFTKADQLPRRIDETWQALIAFELSGTEPANRQALVGWLSEVLDKHRDELRSKHLLRILECFQMLGEQPGNSPQLAEHLEQRFERDPHLRIRTLAGLGEDMKSAKGAGDHSRELLDRVRVLDIPMEISVLAQMFETLNAIGEDYAGTEYFLELLARLQNPDGGLSKPDSTHSNIYDTIAALRMAEVLAVLEIRASRVAEPVAIDGKLSE